MCWHVGSLDGALRFIYPGPGLCQGCLLLWGGLNFSENLMSTGGLDLGPHLDSQVCCPGAVTQPAQPPVPPEASRDPVHLGRLWAAGAGEIKLCSTWNILLQAKHYYSQAIKLAPSNMRALYGLLLTTRWLVVDFFPLQWDNLKDIIFFSYNVTIIAHHLFSPIMWQA